MRRCAASLPPMSGRIAPAMIVSGMRAVSALDASATARSKPATRWKRLIARRTNAGRSQNVSVRSTRSRSIRGLVSITGGRSSSAALAAPRRCRRECRPRSAPRPGGAHHLRRGCGRPVGGGLVVAPGWRPTRPLGSAHARVPGPGRIGRVTAALGWGALAASSLVIGALLGMARDWPPRLVGLVLAFGAGALISAVSFDLAEEGARLGDTGVVAGGLAAGAITYFALDRVVGRRGTGAGGGAGTALALGAFLDGIPEQAVLGIGLASGEGISISLLAAIFVSNLPEAIGASTDLRKAKRSKVTILRMWGAVAVICTLATA